MIWIPGLILSNMGIAMVEYIYKAPLWTWHWYALIPAIVVSQYGLYLLFRNTETLFLAGALFTGGNLAFRMINTRILGEPIDVRLWAGLTLIILAIFILKR